MGMRHNRDPAVELGMHGRSRLLRLARKRGAARTLPVNAKSATQSSGLVASKRTSLLPRQLEQQRIIICARRSAPIAVRADHPIPGVRFRVRGASSSGRACVQMGRGAVSAFGAVTAEEPRSIWTAGLKGQTRLLTLYKTLVGRPSRQWHAAENAALCHI